MSAGKIMVCGLLVGLILVGLGGAQAQQGALPADLIITVPQSHDLPWQNQPHNRLVRVDADTLEMTPFYTDEVAVEVRALDWSPQRDKLAIYRRNPSADEHVFTRELCIINTSGSLLRCVQDRPSSFWAYQNEEDDYHVTWSVDEQTIIFVADREIEGNNRERVLVEADVNTGETLRVLYRSPYVYRKNAPHAFAWTSTLDAVLVGVGGSSTDPALVDLQTGIETHINTWVPEHQELAGVCSGFSPNGAYLAATLVYDLDEYNPWGLDLGAAHEIYHPVIMDRAGQIQASLGDPGIGDLTSFWGCPIWLPDGQSFYIQGWRNNLEQETAVRFIYQYFLATQQLVEYRPISDIITSPLVLAPDNHTLTYSAPISPDAGLDLVVSVLFPDGNASSFKEYDYSAFPVWGPIESPAEVAG
jgi:hypothetical protein